MLPGATAGRPRSLAWPALLVILYIPHSAGESLAGPIPVGQRTIGGGVSIGKNLDKSADFWGWTIDFGRALENGLNFTFSIAYDEETEEKRGQPDKVTQTYTPTFIWAKPLGQRWSVYAGIAKGLIDDSEKKDSFKFSELKDDWGTGVGASYLLYQSGPHHWSVSSTLEYKISDGEFAVSADFGYAYSY